MRVGRNNQEVIVATTQEALQISEIIPSFTVDDLQKSVAFYEALGFTVEERWEEKGTLLGVMLRAGKSRIGLNQDDWQEGRDRKKGIGMRLFMSTTQNVDEIARRAGPPASRSNRNRTTPSGRPERSRSSIPTVSSGLSVLKCRHDVPASEAR